MNLQVQLHPRSTRARGWHLNLAALLPDPYCADTELEGGVVAPAINTLCSVLRSLADGGGGLVFDPSIDTHGLRDDLLSVANRLESGLQLLAGTPLRQLKALRGALEAVVPGVPLVYPAGWAQPNGGHAIMLVLRRAAVLVALHRR